MSALLVFGRLFTVIDDEVLDLRVLALQQQAQPFPA
jgi:hypothetical protein